MNSNLPSLPVLSLFALSLVPLLWGCSEPPPEAPTAAPGAVAQSEARGESAGREPLLHLHVPSKSAEGASRFEADWSYDLVVREGWSAHVHVIPPGQLVPPHHHPEHDELSWVASGRGEWSSWVIGQGPESIEIEPGSVIPVPQGAVHSVRNSGTADLSVVVIHQPSFGQNWYVLPADVVSTVASGPLARSDAFPTPFLEGWTIERSARIAPAQHPADSLYLVGAGAGTLRFEDMELPLEAGHIVKVPPGLRHELASTGGSEAGLDLVVLRIPR